MANQPLYRLQLERSHTLEPVNVSLSHIGEGFDGDYQSDDPDDRPLLRMDVTIYEDGEWHALDNGSYCTHLTCAETDATLDAALAVMAQRIKRALDEGNTKRTCEWLSWMDASNIARFADQAVGAPV